MIHKLYLEFLETDSRNGNEDKLIVTLETSIVLFLLEFFERPSCIQVFLVRSNRKPPEPGVEINRKSVQFTELSTRAYSNELASNCSFPTIVSKNVVIAGLCSVCRAIAKYSEEKFRYILGFRQTCLQVTTRQYKITQIRDCLNSFLTFQQTGPV